MVKLKVNSSKIKAKVEEVPIISTRYVPKKIQEISPKTTFEKFLGSLTKEGNKVLARNLLLKTMLLIKRRHKNELQPMSKIWSSTFKKLQSFTEIKKVTWGKGRKARTNLIPFPLKRKRQNFLKIKWILDSIKEDQRKVNLSLKLADELWNIKYNEKNSKALLKKKDIRKLVLANRSNSHYRW